MIISFTGAQSTGKTTLLNLIRDKNYDFNYVDEVTRRIKREYNLPINESAARWDGVLLGAHFSLAGRGRF